MSGLYKRRGCFTPLGPGKVGNEPLFGDDQHGISCPGDREHRLGGGLVSDSEHSFITRTFG